MQTKNLRCRCQAPNIDRQDIHIKPTKPLSSVISKIWAVKQKGRVLIRLLLIRLGIVQAAELWELEKTKLGDNKEGKSSKKKKCGRHTVSFCEAFC